MDVVGHLVDNLAFPVVATLVATVVIDGARRVRQRRKRPAAPTIPVNDPCRAAAAEFDAGFERRGLQRHGAAVHPFEQPPTREQIAVIQAPEEPTLVVAGTEDRLTPVKYSRFLTDAIAGAQQRGAASNAQAREWLDRQLQG